MSKKKKKSKAGKSKTGKVNNKAKKSGKSSKTGNKNSSGKNTRPVKTEKVQKAIEDTEVILTEAAPVEDKAENAVKGTKAEKTGKDTKTAKTGKSGKEGKAGKAVKSEKTGKNTKTAKTGKTDKEGKAGKAVKSGKSEKNKKTGKTGSSVKTDKKKKASKTDKGGLFGRVFKNRAEKTEKDSGKEKPLKAEKSATAVTEDTDSKVSESVETVTPDRTGEELKETEGRKTRRAYYYDLDIVRALSCIAVLLYHLGILKGGYLAVCTFFVLSGFLTVKSAMQQETFSVGQYYKRRLIQTYIPLAAVTFISVLVITLIPEISWLNLKPETTSVLLGYNNWWQLSASLDYFARHVSSPFMHFWYVAIQLQFDAVFPLIYLFLKKVREKEGKQAQYLFLSMGTILSAIYMILLYGAGSVMAAYYDTFSRVHAILAGILWGIFSEDRRERGAKQKLVSGDKAALFWFSVLIWILMLLFSNSDSGSFPMILTVVLSIVIIELGTREREKNRVDAVFGKISGISYEIYLVQYPVIFLAQQLLLSNWFRSLPEGSGFREGSFLMAAAEIAVTVIIALILKYAEGFRAGGTIIKKRVAVLIAVALLAAGGAVKYVAAEDHTQELKELQMQLDQIAAELEQRQAELLERRKQEEQDWEDMLSTLQNGEEGLKDAVRQLPVVGIGDSVMLGAIPALYSEFPNGYFDAGTSRTSYVANGIVSSIENMGLLGDVVVFNFGANGEGPDWVREEVVDRLADRKVFWLTNTNYSTLWVNDSIKELASSRSNLRIIDWYEISKDHDEYFISDGIHLTDEGTAAFAKAIFDGICEVYREEWQRKVDAIISEHEAAERMKTVFIGNDLLTGVAPYLDESLSDAAMIVTDVYGEDVIQLVRDAVSGGELPHRVVFVFDRNAYLGESDYAAMAEICEGHEVFIVEDDSQTEWSSSISGISIADFGRSSDFFMPDMIHLTDRGNEILAERIGEKLLNGEE